MLDLFTRICCENLTRISEEALRTAQSLATIFSLVAVPIVIALIGFRLQASVSSEGIRRDYVQMAIGIMSDEKANDNEIRKWAIAVLDASSPVPFSPGLRQELEKGNALIITTLPEPPLAMCQDICWHSCDASGIIFKPANETHRAFDELVEQVVIPLRGRLDECEISRLACQQCIDRLKAAGVVR